MVFEAVLCSPTVFYLLSPSVVCMFDLPSVDQYLSLVSIIFATGQVILNIDKRLSTSYGGDHSLVPHQYLV